METMTTTATMGADFSSISTPIVELINSFLTPALAIVGAIGVLYCIVLGVNYAKASEPQEHEKAKNHLKNAIIGFMLIFILMLALKLGTGIMTNWYNKNASGATTTTGEAATEATTEAVIEDTIEDTIEEAIDEAIEVSVNQ